MMSGTAFGHLMIYGSCRVSFVIPPLFYLPYFLGRKNRGGQTKLTLHTPNVIRISQKLFLMKFGVCRVSFVSTPLFFLP